MLHTDTEKNEKRRMKFACEAESPGNYEQTMGLFMVSRFFCRNFVKKNRIGVRSEKKLCFESFTCFLVFHYKL